MWGRVGRDETEGKKGSKPWCCDVEFSFAFGKHARLPSDQRDMGRSCISLG